MEIEEEEKKKKKKKTICFPLGFVFLLSYSVMTMRFVVSFFFFFCSVCCETRK